MYKRQVVVPFQNGIASVGGYLYDRAEEMGKLQDAPVSYTHLVAVRAVPCDLYGHYEKDFLQGILDELEEEPPRGTPAIIAEKLASMACKSAVKGNMRISTKEMEALLDQLLSLENPYHCPHGRPTIITMSLSLIHI